VSHSWLLVSSKGLDVRNLALAFDFVAEQRKLSYPDIEIP